MSIRTGGRAGDAVGNLAEMWGMFLLLGMFFDAVVAGIVLLAGGKIAGWIFPCALALAFVCTFLLSGDWRRAMGAGGAGVLYVIVAILLCSLVYDTTFDGMLYHYDISVMLAEGWNPVYDSSADVSLWIVHYAKVMELIGATVLAFTDNLQSIKCVNFMLAGAALAILWGTQRIVFPKITPKWRVMLTIMAALNPVAIRQFFSLYNDFCLWFETLLLVCAFLRLYRKENDLFAYVVMFMTICLGINTKFTHFFFIGIECLFFAGWLLWRKKYHLFKRCFLVALPGIAVGVGIIGFNPYVTNTIDYYTPFYPLMGDSAVDIMSYNTPEMYAQGNRFENFFKSLLSVSGSPWGMVRGEIPMEGIKESYVGSLRVNGFGVLMFPCLLLGSMLMIFDRSGRRWWVVFLFTFVMCVAFEQTWWARYISFLWLALMIPVVASLIGRKSGSMLIRALRMAIFILVCINGAISVAFTLASRMAYTHYLNYVLATQKEIGRPIETVGLNPAMRQQFRERGVEIREHSDIEEISDKEELFRVFGFYYFESYMLLPEKEYPRLYGAPQSTFDRLARYPERRYGVKEEQ